MGSADPEMVKAWFKRGASFIALSRGIDFPVMDHLRY
jgi:hypothetical protein